ncbi:MAG: LptF/LptG family permease, partial [Verrucomicrobiales bacterium]|nr:LptF/LptG family permease [Verrucomicrobiales bacterium]
MTIFDRYIGRQVLLSTFFAILILTIILVLGKVFKEILTQLAERPELGLAFFLRFLLLVLPLSLSLSVPWAFLTSILLIFGRLSADSELVSMRMAGMNMPRICAPVAFIALCFTGLCGWMNISVGPAAKAELEGMKDTIINMVQKEPLAIFKDGKVMDEIPRHLIYGTKDPENNKLTNFQMVKLNDRFRPEILVIAEEVDITVKADESEVAMIMNMNNAYFETKK